MELTLEERRLSSVAASRFVADLIWPAEAGPIPEFARYAHNEAMAIKQNWNDWWSRPDLMTIVAGALEYYHLKDDVDWKESEAACIISDKIRAEYLD